MCRLQQQDDGELTAALNIETVLPSPHISRWFLYRNSQCQSCRQDCRWLNPAHLCLGGWIHSLKCRRYSLKHSSMLQCVFHSPVLFLKSGKANINSFIYNISSVLESMPALYTESQQKWKSTVLLNGNRVFPHSLISSYFYFTFGAIFCLEDILFIFIIPLFLCLEDGDSQAV